MRCLTLMTVLLLTLPSSKARGEAGETVVHGGVQALQWTQVDTEPASSAAALGGAVGVRHGLDDFWEVALQLGGGAGISDPGSGHPMGTIHLEARYIIDALTWIPWISAGAGALARLGGKNVDARTDATAHLGVGLDYRPRRSWGLSASFRVHQALTDQEATSGPMETTVAAAWYLD
jgi:hypothetical protein